MMGAAGRVVGQKAQCFDCITHPPREKEGRGKKVSVLRNSASFDPEMKIPWRKKRPQRCSLSLKKGNVYICQRAGQKVL